MPGTRTAPDVTLGETAMLFALTWVDDNNKEYTNSFLVNSAVTDIQLEAVSATAQLASNASLWKVQKIEQFEGQKNRAFAASATHESVADKIRYSLKNLATKAYTKAYVPAPLESLVSDDNTIETAELAYTNWKTAVDNAVASGFIALNVEFVQYNQRNDVTSP